MNDVILQFENFAIRFLKCDIQHSFNRRRVVVFRDVSENLGESADHHELGLEVRVGDHIGMLLLELEDTGSTEKIKEPGDTMELDQVRVSGFELGRGLRILFFANLNIMRT